jgi:hypothetical protein
MHDRRRIHSILALILFFAGAALTAAPKPIESFRAFAVALGTGKAGIIDIDIYRWSTDEASRSKNTTPCPWT